MLPKESADDDGPAVHKDVLGLEKPIGVFLTIFFIFCLLLFWVAEPNWLCPRVEENGILWKDFGVEWWRLLSDDTVRFECPAVLCRFGKVCAKDYRKLNLLQRKHSNAPSSPASNRISWNKSRKKCNFLTTK